jgi:hypothetical protein
MTSKQRHRQAKSFLLEQARHEKYILQCVTCQRIGYDEVKLLERNEVLYQEQVQTYYKPITLDAIGRCHECSDRSR